MNDVYQALANSTVGNKLFSAMNLPIPVILERHDPEHSSFLRGRVLVGAAPGGGALEPLFELLGHAPEAEAMRVNGLAGDDLVQQAAQKTGTSVEGYTPDREDRQRFKALVFDATGISSSTELRALWEFFHPVIRKMESCGRVVVIGRTPENCERSQRIAQRGLEGFVRSVAKEAKKGTTANLIHVDEGAEKQLPSALHFFLSPRSAYVSGQPVRVSAADFDPAGFDWKQPLKGRTALVTGAARGIGAAIAEVLARDGARVMVLDIPPMATELREVADRIGGVALEADITADDAPEQISKAAQQEGGLDIVVHNAGVTRDKTLGGMPEKFWDMALGINIVAPERINDQLLSDGSLKDGGRIIGISSIAGIAGNMGQTNYGASKAAVIGMVQSMAPEVAERGITVNAVAPGFIETQMTAAIPFAIRQAGRRMNSMNQGGQPVDVAEAIAFFASPASQGVTGNVLRVCGQSLIGA